VASKHFGHVTFYAADVKSGSIRYNKVGKKFYARKKVLPFVLNPPQYSVIQNGTTCNIHIACNK